MISVIETRQYKATPEDSSFFRELSSNEELSVKVNHVAEFYTLEAECICAVYKESPE